MAIVTRKTVKNYLQISGSTYDNLIDMFIPTVEADFLRIRNTEWDYDSNDDIDYPDNAEFIAAQMIAYLIKNTALSGGYSGMKSESIGSYSYTRGGKEDFDNGYPRYIVDKIERYVRLS